MRKVRKFRLRRRPGKPRRIFTRQVWFALLIFSCAVFILSATMLMLHYGRVSREERELKRLAALVADNTALLPSPDGSTPELPAATPIPVQTPQEPVMLEQYRALYEQNTDMAGWIRVDGTGIDYPVMYTADDFYLSHGFDTAESRSGVPFIDQRCAIVPFGTNTIIYGHHMKNGTMFAGLERYEDEDFFEKHPTVRFDTLYEQREYEIIAVFKSKVYRKSDMVFKHYNFLNAEDAAAYNEHIANIKALSLYDTGVTAAYGDELITLVTCAYHTENGQFVVVAKMIRG
jgi:sortase B